jgi:hypothetical protein
MLKPPLPLTALSEAQRAQAQERFEIIHPAEVLSLFAAFSYLVEATMQGHQGREEFLVTRRFSHLIELLIVDEANRLKDAGLV